VGRPERQDTLVTRQGLKHEGVVVEACPDHVRVELENGAMVTAHISGRCGQSHPGAAGDRVLVELSTYDPRGVASSTARLRAAGRRGRELLATAPFLYVAGQYRSRR